MTGGDVILMARRRAAFTQRELASRLGCRQATIARWERGDRHVAFQDVHDVVDACGLQFDAHLVVEDRSWWPQIAMQLELRPLERVRRLTLSQAHARIEGALRALAETSVSTIVIGDVAGALHGWPLALQSPVVEACSRTGTVEDSIVSMGSSDASSSARVHGFAQHIEVTGTPSGTSGYGDLARGAESIEIDGRAVQVAGLLDLVRIADASTDSGARRRALAYQAVLDVQRERAFARPADLRTDDERIEAWLGAQIPGA